MIPGTRSGILIRIGGKPARAGFAILTALVLASCASGPDFQAPAETRDLTPKQAAQAAEVQGETVVWGGVIVESANLENQTQIEVLSYPLDSSLRPDTDASPTGRFLVLQEGYLETVDYAQGKHLTIKGELTELRTGKVGESAYTYPVVTASNLYLWPEARGRFVDPGVRFGIGIGVGL